MKASGGVMWEGYYIPRNTGRATFSVSSTGFFTMDFAKEGYFENNDKVQTSASQSTIGAGQTYTNYFRVGVSTVVTGTGGVGNQITIPTNRTPTIGIGMTVSGSNISGVPAVSAVDSSTGVITLDPSAGVTNSVSGTLSGSNNITFSRTFGNSVSRTFVTQVLLAFEKYRIRIRYFHPQVLDNDNVLDNQLRNLEKAITQAVSSGSNLEHALPQGLIREFKLPKKYLLTAERPTSFLNQFKKQYDNQLIKAAKQIPISESLSFKKY